MARRYDPRRIKGKRCYTAESLAALYDVHIATVRSWIKTHGLSVAVIDGGRPVLMQGQAIKVWMTEWQDAKKQVCAPDEMYCLGCKMPQRIVPGSFRIIPSNTRKITAQGECVGCRRTLNRFDVRANQEALARQFQSDSAAIPANVSGGSGAPIGNPCPPLKHSLGKG